MSQQTSTDAGSGVKWLSEGFSLFTANPGPFVLMGLILAAIGLVPLLGGLALMLLAPALYGGMLLAYREQKAGRKVEVGQLFAAFQEDGRLAKMLPLCLPGIAAAVVLAVLLIVLLFGALMGAGGIASASKLGSPSGLLHAMTGAGIIGGLIFALLALGIMLLNWALLFTAIPRAMLDDVEPFAAMKESFATVRGNLGAFAIFVLLVGVGYGVVFAVIGSLSAILASLALGAVATPVIVAGIFTAWRQLFDKADDVGEAQPLPPTEPPAPPAAPSEDSTPTEPPPSGE